MISKCQYCGSGIHKVPATEIYGEIGEHWNSVYVCNRFPKCDSYVSSKTDESPRGPLANERLRKARRKCHKIFDEKWKSGKMSRSDAYVWMQKVMGLPPKKAHIGAFTMTECVQLLEILEEENS